MTTVVGRFEAREKNHMLEDRSIHIASARRGVTCMCFRNDQTAPTRHSNTNTDIAR